jgi:hypothetical protein
MAPLIDPEAPRVVRSTVGPGGVGGNEGLPIAGIENTAKSNAHTIKAFENLKVFTKYITLSSKKARRGHEGRLLRPSCYPSSLKFIT